MNEVVALQPGIIEFKDKLKPENSRKEDAGVGAAHGGG